MTTSEIEEAKGLRRPAFWLDRSLRISLPALAVYLPAPLVLGLSDWSSLSVLGLVCLTAFLLARAEPGRARRRFLALFFLALTVRLYMHLFLFRASVEAGGPFLDPDSVRYWWGSVKLAAQGFSLGGHPASIDVFGTSDVAHYYLFAGVLALFGGGLFSLQILNCGLIALVAPLMYSCCRVVAPRYATAGGILIAVYPTLAVLSALNLHKDPSIFFFTALAAWALVRLSGSPKALAIWGFALAAAVALCYLRMDRNYVAFYLEVAVLFVGALSLLTREKVLAHRYSLFAVALVLFVAEAGPGLLGWPLSPQMMVRSGTRAFRTPLMSDYAPGLIEKASAQPAAVTVREPEMLTFNVSTPPNAPEIREHPHEGPSPSLIAKAERSSIAKAEAELGRIQSQLQTNQQDQLKHREALVSARSSESGMMLASLAALVNVFRRLFGPFVWVFPESFEIRELLEKGYLLYPGNLLWYALLPCGIVGLAISLRQLPRGRREKLLLAGFWVYVVISLVQYLSFNLSMRHRLAIFPFFLIFCLLGYDWGRANRRLRLAYAVYWMFLVAVAAGHLMLRSHVGVRVPAVESAETAPYREYQGVRAIYSTTARVHVADGTGVTVSRGSTVLRRSSGCQSRGRSFLSESNCA